MPCALFLGVKILPVLPTRSKHFYMFLKDNHKSLILSLLISFFFLLYIPLFSFLTSAHQCRRATR